MLFLRSCAVVLRDEQAADKAAIDFHTRLSSRRLHESAHDLSHDQVREECASQHVVLAYLMHQEWWLAGWSAASLLFERLLHIHKFSVDISSELLLQKDCY